MELVKLIATSALGTMLGIALLLLFFGFKATKSGGCGCGGHGTPAAANGSNIAAGVYTSGDFQRNWNY